MEKPHKTAGQSQSRALTRYFEYNRPFWITEALTDTEGAEKL